MSSRIRSWVCASALAFLATLTAPACTIFVLADPDGVLFCNNEDSANPDTRLWFVPAAPGLRGCAFVGYRDALPQGGLNDAGLAFDWVAGGFAKWISDTAVPDASGFSAVRMLRTCSTVEEAVTYLQAQRDDPAFAYAHLMVADRSGASAIVDVKKGEIVTQRSTTCRGFGFGARTLDKLLAAKPASTAATANSILAACRQRGRFATKYFTVYNLRNGEIMVGANDEHAESVTINLADELRRGAHIYSIPQLHAQLAQGGQPLPALFERQFVGAHPVIADPQPQRAALLFRSLDELSHGIVPTAALHPEFEKAAKRDLAKIRAILSGWGERRNVVFRGEGAEGSDRVIRYELAFADLAVVLRFTLDADGRLAGIGLEDLLRRSEHGP